MPNTILHPKSLFFMAALSGLSANLQAEVLHNFTAGEPAVAAHMNDNFNDLDDRIIDLGVTVADQSNGINQEVALDCEEDANAFFDTPINSHTTYILTGMCNGPIWISGRSKVTIMGDESGINGVILQGGLTEHPYTAIGAWRSKRISLENLTVDSSNYVSKNYSFGDNVGTITAGEQSQVAVTNVHSIGGDYAVEAYSQSLLRINEGVSITGFNRAGLAASSGSVIRVHKEITVSGVVGTSTDDWGGQAISAGGNSFVQIREGGSFTGSTSSVTHDADDGQLIYPVSVWVYDNGTLNVKSGSNPAVFHSGIENGYSSMIRMEGNAIIHGIIGVYHSSVMRLNNIVQDGGDIWAGDGGYMRIESSTLTPVSIYDPANHNFSLYRAGRARVNNTTINLGDSNLNIFGLELLQLRGSTSIGTAGIECGEYWNVQIAESVTHGPVSCQQ
jgi:hypothetical protein